MFQTTPIQDLLIYKPKVFGDHRGRFFESFNSLHFKEVGITVPFVQDNRSISTKGILRGLHMQLGEHSQAKLVSVLRGQVYDVAVDLRVDSATYGKWYGLHLSEDVIQSLYIPRGFAHGFVVLSEQAEFFYKVDNFYNKESESGLHFADSDLAIEWPFPAEQVILSEKDKVLPSLRDFSKQLGKSL